MTLIEANEIATGAQRKRDANETYQLSIEELKAIDAILIEQAGQRLKREHQGKENLYGKQGVASSNSTATPNRINQLR